MATCDGQRIGTVSGLPTMITVSGPLVRPGLVCYHNSMDKALAPHPRPKNDYSQDENYQVDNFSWDTPSLRNIKIRPWPMAERCRAASGWIRDGMVGNACR